MLSTGEGKSENPLRRGGEATPVQAGQGSSLGPLAQTPIWPGLGKSDAPARTGKLLDEL